MANPSTYHYYGVYGAATVVYFATQDVTDTDDLYTGTAFAAGDAKVSTAGGAVASTTNTPAQITASQPIYSLTLTGAEMQGREVFVTIRDQTEPEVFEPVVIQITTEIQVAKLLIDASNNAANSVAMSVVGNGNAAGITVLGGSGAAGILAQPGGGNFPGIQATGNGTAGGFQGTGGATGAGILGIGGATSGAGIQGTGTAGNSPGISGVGQGTAGGVLGTGGATGAGIQGTGGATSGPGIRGTGTAGNSAGIEGAGQGTAAGVQGSGGASNGSGIKGTGGATNSAGIEGVGLGTGGGIKGVGGATGYGIEGQGNAGGGTAAAKITNLFSQEEGSEPTVVINDLATFGVILQHLKRRFTNKMTQTATVQTWYRDNSSTTLQTCAVSDDGTTQSKNKVA